MRKTAHSTRYTALMAILLSLATLTHCMKAQRIDTDINGPKGLSNLIGAWIVYIISTAYTGTQFVAVGNSGVAWWSDDGINWNQTAYALSDGSTGRIESVAFSGSRWVGVGMDGDGPCGVWYSDDGRTWTKTECPANMGSNGYLRSVAYGNGIFLAGGNCGGGTYNSMRSTDGVSWEPAQTCSGSYDIYSLVYGPNHNAFYGSLYNGVVPTYEVFKYANNTLTLMSDPTGMEPDNGYYLFPNHGNKVLGLGEDASNVPYALEVNLDDSWSTSAPTSLSASTSCADITYANGSYITAGKNGSNGILQWATSISLDPWNSDAAFSGESPGLEIAYHSTLQRYVVAYADGAGGTFIYYSNNLSSWTQSLDLGGEMVNEIAAAK